jgi:hypothetical protein
MRDFALWGAGRSLAKKREKKQMDDGALDEEGRFRGGGEEGEVGVDWGSSGGFCFFFLF